MDDANDGLDVVCDGLDVPNDGLDVMKEGLYVSNSFGVLGAVEVLEEDDSYLFCVFLVVMEEGSYADGLLLL